ncbi:MAG: hypothetical protein A2487_13425 [Candidatus Raymondbacteria bacterium RifOxyC12_full_50_8]|uniref:Uncharacterized protein n=1 Tax=Candidatus Raymondbacteria bacterium RIFOXYD12_FULL_49_13 TaxID=1817890 RepID=A0A1F7F7S7_UNCRA|nr:MAG: hypothetical protein A2248_13535 [Candidatus Raymondbacteria bacterium RIFOXYA2_FULL_49_16]OGJ95147.1 MAG: hypothetical protein A2350_09390 [Candidatus Raymondbacteria bacterium RifOxyB12_full_50_8]OGK00359.1 MAG: hypothetical protein A2487_13425 [Candidatus Raymondbacteria bacterium RifOxyC12_full_50_8]OGK02724.1 MAG: hypothetical protein A2519_09685 [Candidatus Raymondbacteria bacterium RIFOXYD12_FULL_49_13]OGP42370.1 MAG: hypothetical protein A2324_20355 [Candidatus Raymondbacteria b
MLNNIDWHNDKIFSVLLVALIAFVAWLSKRLIEKPFDDSRKTYFNFAEKRIRILSLIKTRLIYISLFPVNHKLKEELQNTLLSNGDLGLLNRDMLNMLIELSVNKEVNEKRLLNGISNIDSELALQIGKIKDEYSFYVRYSGVSPYKKVLGYIIITTKSILSLTLICLLSFLLIRFILGLTGLWIAISIIVILILVWLTEKHVLHKIK